MVDNLTPEDRLKTMRAVKGSGTRIERRLFGLLAGMRLSGWRKHANEMRGKPDVVFDEQRLAIFVDGCFWHGCPHCRRPLPETNKAYWERKIQRNVGRAQATNESLRAQGWAVIRIWEHEIGDKSRRAEIAEEIRAALRR
jgi:DNA mismatch endonuclease (patch repair protein)